MSGTSQDAPEQQLQAKPTTGIPLKIDYSKPDTVPPVYVAGSFTSWQPVELTLTSEKPEEPHYVHEFSNVEEGEHQYKFRLGPGDWWTTDERVKSVTDEHGNKNNVITLKKGAQATNAAEAPKQPSKTAEQIPKPVAADPAPTSATTAKTSVPTSAASTDIPVKNPALADAATKTPASPADSTVKTPAPLADTTAKTLVPTSNPVADSANKTSPPTVDSTVKTLASTLDTTVKTPAPTSDTTAKSSTSAKQAANTAAEVTATPSKLDQTPSSQKNESTEAKSPEQVAAAASTKLDNVLAQQMRDSANAKLDNVLTKQMSETSASDEIHKPDAKGSVDAIASPSMPPVPTVTPETASPSQSSPVRPDRVDAQLRTPAPVSPLKSLDSVSPPAESKPIAAVIPSAAQLIATVAAKVKSDDKAPAQVALPPSPPASPQQAVKPNEQSGAVTEPSQSGDFPQDDSKVTRRPTTLQERGASVFETIMAIPNLTAALFASIIQAFVDWVNRLFSPQQRGQGAKDKKTA